MGTRINLKITNSSDEIIKCRQILCQNIEGLDVGDELTPGQTGTYTISTNDKVFCKWQSLMSQTEYHLAMTSPKSSHNSAAGYGSAGLQHYERGGTPVDFHFKIGTKDYADWDNGDEYKGNKPEYGSCSK